jgi:hypothetical protein
MAHATPEQKTEYGISLSVSPNMPKAMGEVKKKVTKPNGDEMGGSTCHDRMGAWERSANGEHWLKNDG